MFLRSAYNYDTEKVSLETGLECTGESVTQQQFKDDCDINVIVERFGLTGELPENVRVPQSGDFTGVTDYLSAMIAIKNAQSGFMELPADLRRRFENDPQRLLMFMEDPKNREEAIALGLVNKAPEVTRDVVTAIDELASKMVVKS